MKLSEVVEVNPKKSEIDKSVVGNVSFVAMADVSEDGFISNDQSRSLNEVYKGYTYFRKNDVLLAKITPCFENGKAAIANEITHEIGFGSSEFHVLRASHKLDPKFLFYLLWNEPLRVSLSKKMTGSAGQKRIPTDVLKKLEIPLPTLTEQKAIVAKLDRAQRLIDIDKQMLAKYDQLIQSVFLDMFGDPVTNSKGWEVSNLGKHIDVLTDYHANGSYKVLKKHVSLKDKKDYALMVRTTDLENNNFEDGVKYIDEEAYNFLEKSKIFGNEIIINKIGSAGNVYLMPSLNRPVSLGMNAFLLRFKSSLIRNFIFYQLTSDYGENEIQKRIKGAVTKTIRKDAVREIPIIVPPLLVQEEFEKVVNNVESQKIEVESSLKKSQELFSSLAQEVFG